MDTTTRSPIGPLADPDRRDDAIVEPPTASAPTTPTEAPTASPEAADRPIPRDELMQAFDASWGRNEAAYRYLGR